MKFEQSPYALLMVRPASFGHNGETQASNAFQHAPDREPDEISRLAVTEFDAMVTELQRHEIDVRVFQDASSVSLPDAVFPNNWISFQPDGTIILYPMMAGNRRRERREDIVGTLQQEFRIEKVVDISEAEEQGRFLEGTGSIVFDHAMRVAFACRSPRTDEKLFRELCGKINYKAIAFDAVDERGVAIYHTNVMMAIGTTVAVICLDAIRDDAQQEIILDHLAQTGRRIVAISMEQVRAFAGNMMEVISVNGQRYIVFSDTALRSLLPGQVHALSERSELITVAIPTIQQYGGGGVRCMVAGIHMQRLR